MKAFKRVCNGLTTVLLVMMLGVAGMLLGPKLLGYQSYAVRSGSMEPTYKIGSMIFVKPATAAEIEVGDAITFFVKSGGSTVATHRVVEIDAEKQLFYTKGDNNPNRDPSTVSFEQLVGKAAKFSAPGFGSVSQFLQTGYGKVAAVSAFVFVVLLLFLPDWVTGGKKKEKPSQPPQPGEPGEPGPDGP